MSLLLPDSGLLIWMLLSFGIVFALLAKFGFPIITEMVNQRKDFIDKSLDAANKANEQLASVKADCEKLIAEANQEHGRIFREAIKEREDILAHARQEAQESARKEVEELHRQIQTEKELAIQEIRQEIAKLSVDVAEKIIRKKLSSKEEQEDLINRMLDEVLNSTSKMN